MVLIAVHKHLIFLPLHVCVGNKCTAYLTPSHILLTSVCAHCTIIHLLNIEEAKVQIPSQLHYGNKSDGVNALEFKYGASE